MEPNTEMVCKVLLFQPWERRGLQSSKWPQKLCGQRGIVSYLRFCFTFLTQGWNPVINRQTVSSSANQLKAGDMRQGIRLQVTVPVALASSRVSVLDAPAGSLLNKAIM